MEMLFPDGLLDQSVEIGAITDRSVRVWVLQPDQPSLRGVLTVEGLPPVTASANLSAATDWTGVLRFELDRPAPGALATCEIAGERRGLRLAQSPGTPSSLTFGFGSCNQPFALEHEQVVHNVAGGIYTALGKDLERAQAQFLMLLGDQIYSDALDPISVRGHFDSQQDDPPSHETLVQAYRHVTRGYLGHDGFRQLRERIPTYAIWDDHDIFDNWGSRQRVTPLDTSMFNAAAHVYREYQHPRNPVEQNHGPPFHYFFQYGDVGFFVLDVRGARDWSSGQLLGEHQWQELQLFLRGRLADSISTLFIATSVPLAHVSRWLTTIFERLPGRASDSVRDRWSAVAFRDQRDALLEELFAWQSITAERQVILLSGDVHVASAFTIWPRDHQGVIQQFTSSAFSTPATSFERYLNLFAVRQPNLLEECWRFRRHFLHFGNNGGLVRLTPLDSGGHHVELLIRGWDPDQAALSTVARFSCQPSIS